MDKELIIFFFIIQLQFLTAEVVYSDPNFATELDSITVYFNAAEGDLISLPAYTTYSLVQQGTNLLLDAALGDLLLVNISISSFNAATSIVFG